MSSTPEETLTEHKHYTYNSEAQKYVFHTEIFLGKNYVLDTSKVDTILKLYSNFDKQPYTAGEIAQRTSTPKKVIEFVIRALGMNHNSIPYTDEKIEVSDENTLVGDLLIEKRANVEQRFERTEWKNTQNDADSWRLFKYNYGQVFDDVIKNWNPPAYVPTQYTYPKTGDKELIIGCSDWHYGLVANERYLYNQKEWNIEETATSVKNYALQLCKHIEERGNPYNKVTLTFLGDLLHGLDGLTDKGTKLEAHPLREEQLEKAYNSVLEFIQILLGSIGNIRILAVPGNHSSFGDYFLLKMLSIYFKDDKRLTFEITSKRFLTFEVGSNLFLMDHGYSAITKSRLPAHGTGRENYLNNLFMAKPEQMRNAKRLYYISGDQHHMESAELTNMETYMMSTLVGGCRYSDNSGYKSRPRQSCLVVDDQGVKEFIHFYFD